MLRISQESRIEGVSQVPLTPTWGLWGMASEQGTVSKRMYPSGRSQAQVE